MPWRQQQREVGGVDVVDPLAPEPTAQFTEALTTLHATAARATPAMPPVPTPELTGCRVLMWKQYPSLKVPGRRLVYLPGLVLGGPSDARITTRGPTLSPAVGNANGDFIFPAGTPEADCANAFAVVRQTLALYERALGGERIPWAWNVAGNVEPITVYPRGFATANACYSRYQKALTFGYFTPTQHNGDGRGANEVFTCRSLDIVAHQTAHAILDGLKPHWLNRAAPPQAAALHEAFADLTTIFVTLTQLDQVEAFVAMTEGDLHRKTFLPALAEHLGGALGRPMGLENADNDLRLIDVSNDVHDLSRVFTGAIFDILADIYAFEVRRQHASKDPARVLLEVTESLSSLVLQAFLAAPDSPAAYLDVINNMLTVSKKRSDPPLYRTVIRQRFSRREIAGSPTPLKALIAGRMDWDDPSFTDGKDGEAMKPLQPSHPSAQQWCPQDRSGCCGTMQLPEYAQSSTKLDVDLQRLAKLAPGEILPDAAVLADEIAKLAFVSRAVG